jgi:hypothetical protein
MAETLNKDELLGKALGTKLAVSPAAEAVSLKAPEPVAAPVDFSGAKAEKTIPVKENYMAAIKPDMDALRTAEEEKLKFAGLEKIDLAEREAAKQYKLSESAAQQKKEILDDPARAEYKKALEDKAKPFVPHQENAEDMMMLFGLLNVVGFAIGSGGKEYSQAAMSAMNGMLEGHQKGRDDLYKKEKSIFETNQKQLDSRIKQLLAFMQDNELLTNMDKTARDQAIQSEFLQTGATFLSEYYKKNGYGKTVETLKEMARASGKAAELVAKENARAAEQDFSLRLETQKAKEARERERDKVLAQYDLASLKLNEEAKQAKANRDFRLEEEKLRRSFEIEKAKADWTHGEALAEINRTHATNIELARIERDKIRDKDTAEYRLKDKEYQDKRLKLEDDRFKESVRHDKAQEALRAKEIAAKEAKATGAGSDTASDVKNFLGVNFGSGKQADAKYDQAAAAANTSAEALALSNIVRKSPDVVGRVGQAKGFIDRYVKSLSSDGLETDKTPVPTNRQEQEALLFSKRYAAYLIRYEQALAGSAKGFTVSFMNRFNNLMQQNQFNAEGFDGLMKEQIREIAAKSAVLSTKITPENLMRLGVAQTRDPDAIEAFGRMQGGGGTAPAAGSSVDAERSRAKAAIAAGAPEAAVKERFKAKTGQEL